MERVRKRKWRWRLGVLGAVVLLVATCSKVTSPFDDREFDQTVWLQAGGKSDRKSPRGLMYDDLKSTLLRDKPTREQVLRMLGEPDVRKENESIEYLLGAWSGFRIDYDTIVISFDKADRVKSVHRYQE
jgi:hypothetical protein